MLNLILQSDLAGKMDFGYERAGNASHLSVNRLCQHMAAAIL